VNQQFYKNMALWVVILVVILLFVTMLKQEQTAPPEIAFSEFLINIDASNIEQVTIEDEGLIHGQMLDGGEFTTFAPVISDDLIAALHEHRVTIHAKPKDESSFWRQILIMWFPLLLFIGLWLFFIRQMQAGGGKAMSFGKSKARLLTENDQRMTFADVAGIEESKAELEEIIDFSGVELYIGTPVKRYSTGMKVRLAFAVAAHLEPEILVIDEVLAVGDADFQRRAIGKMEDISKGEGRTILFVSHDMTAIKRLTSRCLVLQEGELAFEGETIDAVSHYLRTDSLAPFKIWEDIELAPGNDFARLRRIAVMDRHGEHQTHFNVTEDILLEVEYWDLNEAHRNTVILHIRNERGEVLFATNEFTCPRWREVHDCTKGRITARCRIPGNLMAEGSFTVCVAVGNYNPNMVHLKEDDVVSFQVHDTTQGEGVRGIATNAWPGLIRPMLDWEIEKTPLS